MKSKGMKYFAASLLALALLVPGAGAKAEEILPEENLVPVEVPVTAGEQEATPSYCATIYDNTASTASLLGSTTIHHADQVKESNVTASNWVDRVDWVGHQDERNFYDTLIAASTLDKNDGVPNFLIEDSYFNSNASIPERGAQATSRSDGSSVVVGYAHGGEWRENQVYLEQYSNGFSRYLCIAHETANTLEAAIDLVLAKQQYYMAASAAFERDHPEVFWLESYSPISAEIYPCGPEVPNPLYQHVVDSLSGDVLPTSYEVVFKYTLNSNLNSKYSDIRINTYRTNQAISDAIETFEAAILNIHKDARYSAAKTQLEKVTFFNDWLCANNEYYKGMLTPQGSSPDDYETYHAHRSLRALMGGSQASGGVNGPVCEGYATAFKVLCDRDNIDCTLTSGNSRGQGHIWNYVRFSDSQTENQWYGVDVTWNDGPTPDYVHFLKSQVILDQDHTIKNTGTTISRGYQIGEKIHMFDAHIFAAGPQLETNSFTEGHPLKPETAGLSVNWQADTANHWKEYTGYGKVSVGAHDHKGQGGACSVCGKTFAPIELTVTGSTVTVGFYGDKATNGMGIVAEYDGGKMVSVHVYQDMNVEHTFNTVKTENTVKAFLLDTNKAPVTAAVSQTAA